MSLANRADPIELQYTVSSDLDLHYMSISQHMLLVLIDIISVTYVVGNIDTHSRYHLSMMLAI